jgi:copper homeostasis protein
MLEVCVEDISGLWAAVEGGADRIELCSALTFGGLTPSEALIVAAVRAPVPVHILIRPRAGDFVYDVREVDLLVADISSAVAAGCAGIVIGASRPDSTLDTALLEKLVSIARSAAVQRAKPVALTLHRVFDLCKHPLETLEAAVRLGFDRILTSGGAESALSGRAALTALARQTHGRIKILAGAGINPSNVGTILATGVDEIHASCQAPLPPPDPRLIELGFVAPRPYRTTASAVKDLAAAMQRWHSGSSGALSPS